jgi:isocitrate/isopropylmalate dehydrogenase
MWMAPRAPLSRTPRVVALGGDGIGPEVVAAALACVRASGARLEISEPLHGEAAVRAGQPAFPDALEEELEQADGVLFGAVDTERGQSKAILLHLRFGLDTYANLRPAQSLPGIPAVTGGGRADLVIVRELSEGLYPGREGELADLARALPLYRDPLGRALPESGRFAIRVVTEAATRRVARYAARLAAHRKQRGAGPGRVTVVTKANVFRQSDGLFLEVCRDEIAKLGLEHDHLYVDEAARRLVVMPETFDVVVTSNLFGDILSDVASEVMGGMPMAPSASVGDGHAYFESCHGSAPDLAGKDLANPSATILSAAMMLSWLGQEAEAERLVGAVLAAIAAGDRTRDLGGSLSCSGFTQAVCRRISAA